MRFAYVALMLNSQSGVINKLESQAEVCVRERIPIDFYWITPCKPNGNGGYLNIISVNRNPALARCQQAAFINRMHKKYDKVVLRYPLADPFFMPLLKSKNSTIIEHHSKEINELNLKKDFRYLLERCLGGFWIRKFGGLIGVTPEIVDYEIARSGFHRKALFLPNSIDASKNSFDLGDRRDEQVVNIVMVANFRPWHGLELVVEALKEKAVNAKNLVLHVVGKLNGPLLKLMEGSDFIKIYGELSQSEIDKIYEISDLALGSFNMECKGMVQSTALKVREAFSRGVACIEGSKDPAFPEGFPYILNSTKFDVDSVIDFGMKMKSVQRSEIRSAALPYIDSAIKMRELHGWLSSIG